MKKIIISLLAPYFYPQIVFSKSILKYIKKDEKEMLVDCPCGNGETSYIFSKQKNLSVLGYDNSSVAIENANKLFKNKNLFYEKKDIQEMLDSCKPFKYFSLINSLFLLNNQGIILDKIYNSLKQNGKLFVIVPNIDGTNFKNFSAKSNNRNVNNMVLSLSELETFFRKHKFIVEKTDRILYAHHYGRKYLEVLSVFSHTYLRILNSICTRFNIGNCNYYLIVLTK